jgi:hypothetical protein
LQALQPLQPLQRRRAKARDTPRASTGTRRALSSNMIIKSGVKAGSGPDQWSSNHNGKRLVVKSSIKAGLLSSNHGVKRL